MQRNVNKSKIKNPGPPYFVQYYRLYKTLIFFALVPVFTNHLSLADN